MMKYFIGVLGCDGSPTKTFLLNAHRINPLYKYWHLSFGFQDEVELFDLKKDPNYVDNLIDDIKYENIQMVLSSYSI